MSDGVIGTLVLITLGAFVLGLIIGRWPTWSRRRRSWAAGAAIVAAIVGTLVWAAGNFAGIDPHSLTLNRLMLGSGRCLKSAGDGDEFWGRPRDGWNRPFVERLSVEHEVGTDKSGEVRPRDYLAFEVRSRGPNGALDDADDLWVQFEVQADGGSVRLIGRRWGTATAVQPERWTFPHAEQADVKE